MSGTCADLPGATPGAGAIGIDRPGRGTVGKRGKASAGQKCSTNEQRKKSDCDTASLRWTTLHQSAYMVRQRLHATEQYIPRQRFVASRFVIAQLDGEYVEFSKVTWCPASIAKLKLDSPNFAKPPECAENQALIGNSGRLRLNAMDVGHQG